MLTSLRKEPAGAVQPHNTVKARLPVTQDHQMSVVWMTLLCTYCLSAVVAVKV